MIIDFNQKNYIVTGGAGSIGSEIVKGIINSGGCVCAIDRDEESLFQLSSLLGDRCKYKCIDCADVELLRKTITEIIEEYGRIHGLVNCVGVISTSSFEDITLEEWNRVITINLTSVFAAIQSVFPHMKENKFGRIVTVSSVAGKIGGGILGKCAYATSKAGVNGLTKAIAKEVGKYGICCNAVCPGWTDSRMVNGILTSHDYDRIKSMVSLARPGSPDEMAAHVLFYLSDYASYINGEVSDTDGGLTYD